MTRKTKHQRVDKYHAAAYAGTGRVFLESAQALSTVADEGAPYGNAIGLLAIHAVISYADALSIALGETKSTDVHAAAADHLAAVLGADLPKDMAKCLRKMLIEKDVVSYQGHLYDLAEGRRLLAQAAEFCAWARDYLQRRS
jgi:hypothetical protein